MPGSRIGGLKAAATNKLKYGDSFYQLIGSLGGSKTGRKGFALMTPAQRFEAGKKGGTISRRGKAVTPYIRQKRASSE